MGVAVIGAGFCGTAVTVGLLRRRVPVTLVERTGSCLGLRTADDGALIGRDGLTSDRLFTLGALRRAELWETIAVPDLRTQAVKLAERLAPAAHP